MRNASSPTTLTRHPSGDSRRARRRRRLLAAHLSLTLGLAGLVAYVLRAVVHLSELVNINILTNIC